MLRVTFYDIKLLGRILLACNDLEQTTSRFIQGCVLHALALDQEMIEEPDWILDPDEPTPKEFRAEVLSPLSDAILRWIELFRDTDGTVYPFATDSKLTSSSAGLIAGIAQQASVSLECKPIRDYRGHSHSPRPAKVFSVDLHIPPQILDVLERAADREGQTTLDFILATVDRDLQFVEPMISDAEFFRAGVVDPIQVALSSGHFSGFGVSSEQHDHALLEDFLGNMEVFTLWKLCRALGLQLCIVEPHE